MAVAQNTQLPGATDPTQPQPPKPPVLPGATGTPGQATTPTVGAAAPPMTPPAASPVPVPTNTPTLAPAPTTAPTVAGAYDTPGGTFTPQAANVSTAGAANNPVGNASIQWVTDPVTGAFVKAGQQNVQQANGQFLDGSGALTDPAGTTRTDYFDGGSGNPGAAPPSTIQRPGGPVTATPGSAAPTVGQFGGPSVGAASPASAAASAPFTTASGAQVPPATGNPGSALLDAALGAPSGAASSASNPLPGVGLSQTDPNADLRSDTILPTNDVNRMDLANKELQNYEQQQLPQFRSDLRKAFQNNAALGRNGSGMLRTDVGNLDLAEQNNYNTKKTSLLDEALGNTINDAANNRNEYRTERGYQTGQENQAYDRGVQGMQLEDALTNSAFGRSLAQQNAGQANNPANMQLLLSQIFGQQATGAGNALSGLVRNNASNGVVNGAQPGSPSSTAPNLMGDISQLPQWLQDVLNGKTDESQPDPSPEDAYGVAP